MFKTMLLATIITATISCAPAHMSTKNMVAQTNLVDETMTSRTPLVIQNGTYWIEDGVQAPPAVVTGEYYFEIEGDNGPTILRPVYIRPAE